MRSNVNMAKKSEHVRESAGAVSREISSFMEEHPSLEYDQESKKVLKFKH